MENYNKTMKHSRFLQGSEVEIIREFRPAAPPEHVMYDFNGTISLIREGWQQIMCDLIVELLRGTVTRETDDELSVTADDFIAETTGV